MITKEHIKTLHHHPKRVATISIIIALAIGIFGYIEINKKVPAPVVADNSSAGNVSGNSSPSHDLTLAFLTGGRIESVYVKAGDKVSKGQILAALDSGNTKGALAEAQAAYQKIIDGATGTDIDVAKAAVNTAEVNLDGVTKQQTVLVDNAYSTLLNSSIAATPVGNYIGYNAPIVSGSYTCSQEGSYDLKTYSSTSGISVTYSGMEQGSLLLTNIPRPMGNCGLFLSSSETNAPEAGAEFTVDIPNTDGANYNSNNNAYQLALQNKQQAIAGAQATLDQANASLTALVTAARPEDVTAAEGAVEIAQAAYDNTIITAPEDGTVVSVAIAPGQIATPNAPAVQFTSTVSSGTSN
jgi:multidrug efflux pump subunit AcrA (membrane-fusion protein)